jgi:deoxyribose-phosphate aldolase
MELNGYIDHTILDPLAGEPEVERYCNEVIQNHFSAVCVQPKWISLASFLFRQTGFNVATVVDFPFGASPLSIRLKQVEHYILEGANEIDLVAPLSYIKSHQWVELFKDIHTIRQLVGTRAMLKVIIEVSLFSDEEIIEASKTCAQAGCHMIKTSTGVINKRPTEVKDILLIKEGLADYPDVHIKASAGIKTKEQAIALIEAGATRIGTSSGLNLIG